MEMLERCPGCSVAREVEPKKAETGPTFISSSRRARACANCGYDGQFLPSESDASSRDSLSSFAGARAKLATATQDLFRLSGSHTLPSQHSNSIPVETSVSAPPAAPVSEKRASENPASSARKPEASIMFSLEALMKANQAPAKPGSSDDPSSQLWDMQAAEPLFGTAADDALLTTPLKMERAQSMDSMTLPSETPNSRRWWPIALAASAGLALAAGGIWMFGSGGHPVTPASAASEQAKIEAQPPVEPPAVLPAPAVVDPPAAEHAADAPVSGEPAPPVSEPAVAAPSADTADATVNAAVPSEPVASGARSKEQDKQKEKDKPSSRKAPPRATPPRAVPLMSKTIVPFDKNAAKGALNDAASKAASCGAGGAPGKGKIQVTFGVNGKVSDAQLVEGAFAGTTAGKCALRHFRAAKVPAFAGAPVTVAKSFKVD